MVQLSSQYVPFEHRARVMSLLTLSYVVGDFVSRDILGLVRKHYPTCLRCIPRTTCRSMVSHKPAGGVLWCCTRVVFALCL